MNASRWLTGTALGLLSVFAAAAPSTSLAQGASVQPPAANPPMMIVSIYRIAPGRQLDFLKYMAQLDTVAKEAGLSGQQLYSHVDGDSWDYIFIRSAPSDADQAKLDAISRKHGLPTGFASGLKIREFVSSHTDTYSRGPTTASELVAAAARM